MTKIRITTDQGEILIDAYLHGKFAVNRVAPGLVALRPADALWAITHRATGREVTQRRGCKVAREVARRLDAAVAVDISAADYIAKNDAARAFGKAVKAVLDADA